MNVEFWANFSKRRNSLAVPGASGTTKTCVLKDDTSITTPIIRLNGHTYFSYNYAYISDFNRYYYINDIKTVGPDTEIYLVCDVLATFRTDILNSTQYVCYSSDQTSIWLADTRIPIKKSETLSENHVSPAIFNSIGFYALTVTGKTGTEVFALTATDIKALISNINTWATGLVNGINDGTLFNINYDFSSPESAIESLSYILSQSGVLGNSYANAPQNIRSCIWLPLSRSAFSSGTKRVYLGDWDTTVDGASVTIGPVTGSFTINIPWQHSDWRRSVCESLLLYLPFAGCINIPVDLVLNESVITIRWSISATDGTVSYLVYAGSNNIIGTYGGTLGANYAIGINQQASLGEIVQTAYNGLEKTVSAAINTSISPLSAAAGITGVALNGINTAFDVANVAMSTHPTTIGNFGGCTGIGLTLGVVFLASVSHDTVVAPSSMAATMGYPTMAQRSLTGLTGFCQCANAHLPITGTADEKNAVDNFLNSGIYIE